MKSMTKLLASTLVLIGVLAGCKASQAPDTAANSPEAAVAAPASAMPTTPMAETTPAPETEAASMPIPETADGIWQAIDMHTGELKAAIGSGALNTVHEHAFAIRDLVAALPAHSPSLSTEDQAKQQADVKFVATLADRLDETGDAGDKAGTQSNYEKLSAVLAGMTRTK